jgi:hypothetical protein
MIPAERCQAVLTLIHINSIQSLFYTKLKHIFINEIIILGYQSRQIKQSTFSKPSLSASSENDVAFALTGVIGREDFIT